MSLLRHEIGKMRWTKRLSVGIGLPLMLIVLAMLVTIWFGRSAGFRGTAYGEPYPVAPSIELIQADGETFRLSDQRGKIILLFFGYTFCPDVCPTTMAEMKLVVDELGDLAVLCRWSSSPLTLIAILPKKYRNMRNISTRISSVCRARWKNSKKSGTDTVCIAPSTRRAPRSVILWTTPRVLPWWMQMGTAPLVRFPDPVDDIVHDIKLLLR